ncbi:MAG: carotenoid biosynthesis protein [Verrucomicrobiales bacterium]|jgi:uncharacterized membrane protein|nr:carotenoid biosynthesis protein [Verrucomicrobiales bacterium]
MNRAIRNICWHLFLACAALEFIISTVRTHAAPWPALTVWVDFTFFALAAAVVLCEAAAHAGWRPALLALLIISTVSGAACWFGASYLRLTYTPMLGPLIARTLPLAVPLLWWSLIGGGYLVWHRVLPLFDARMVAFLTAISALTVGWLLEPFATRVKFYWTWEHGAAPWQYYLGWLALAFILARVVPLQGDSQPVSCRRPLTVTLVMAAWFALGRWLSLG